MVLAVSVGSRRRDKADSRVLGGYHAGEAAAGDRDALGGVALLVHELDSVDLRAEAAVRYRELGAAILCGITGVAVVDDRSAGNHDAAVADLAGDVAGGVNRNGAGARDVHRARALDDARAVRNSKGTAIDGPGSRVGGVDTAGDITVIEAFLRNGVNELAAIDGPSGAHTVARVAVAHQYSVLSCPQRTAVDRDVVVVGIARPDTAIHAHIVTALNNRGRTGGSSEDGFTADRTGLPGAVILNGKCAVVGDHRISVCFAERLAVQLKGDVLTFRNGDLLGDCLCKQCYGACCRTSRIDRALEGGILDVADLRHKSLVAICGGDRLLSRGNLVQAARRVAFGGVDRDVAAVARDDKRLTDGEGEGVGSTDVLACDELNNGIRGISSRNSRSSRERGVDIVADLRDLKDLTLGRVAAAFGECHGNLITNLERAAAIPITADKAAARVNRVGIVHVVVIAACNRELAAFVAVTLLRGINVNRGIEVLERASSECQFKILGRCFLSAGHCNKALYFVAFGIRVGIFKRNVFVCQCDVLTKLVAAKAGEELIERIGELAGNLVVAAARLRAVDGDVDEGVGRVASGIRNMDRLSQRNVADQIDGAGGIMIRVGASANRVDRSLEAGVVLAANSRYGGAGLDRVCPVCVLYRIVTGSAILVHIRGIGAALEDELGIGTQRRGIRELAAALDGQGLAGRDGKLRGNIVCFGFKYDAVGYGHCRCLGHGIDQRNRRIVRGNSGQRCGQGLILDAADLGNRGRIRADVTGVCGNARRTVVLEGRGILLEHLQYAGGAGDRVGDKRLVVRSIGGVTDLDVAEAGAQRIGEGQITGSKRDVCRCDFAVCSDNALSARTAATVKRAARDSQLARPAHLVVQIDEVVAGKTREGASGNGHRGRVHTADGRYRGITASGRGREGAVLDIVSIQSGAAGVAVQQDLMYVVAVRHVQRHRVSCCAGAPEAGTVVEIIDAVDDVLRQLVIIGASILHAGLPSQIQRSIVAEDRHARLYVLVMARIHKFVSVRLREVRADIDQSRISRIGRIGGLHGVLQRALAALRLIEIAVIVHRSALRPCVIADRDQGVVLAHMGKRLGKRRVAHTGRCRCDGNADCPALTCGLAVFGSIAGVAVRHLDLAREEAALDGERAVAGLGRVTGEDARALDGQGLAVGDGDLAGDVVLADVEGRAVVDRNGRGSVIANELDSLAVGSDGRKGSREIGVSIKRIGTCRIAYQYMRSNSSLSNGKIYSSAGKTDCFNLEFCGIFNREGPAGAELNVALRHVGNSNNRSALNGDSAAFRCDTTAFCGASRSNRSQSGIFNIQHRAVKAVATQCQVDSRTISNIEGAAQIGGRTAVSGVQRRVIDINNRNIGGIRLNYAARAASVTTKVKRGVDDVQR